MANEKKIWQFTREAGYDPLEGRCIVVSPAPDNLSDRIVSFFTAVIRCNTSVLQMCKNELVFLPFDPVWTSLHKNASLILPYSEILSVTLADELLDTIITIQTNNDEIRLATQQKALSDWRMSGFNATQFAGGYKNWHKENIDETLKALTLLGGEAGN